MSSSSEVSLSPSQIKELLSSVKSDIEKRDHILSEIVSNTLDFANENNYVSSSTSFDVTEKVEKLLEAGKKCEEIKKRVEYWITNIEEERQKFDKQREEKNFLTPIKNFLLEGFGTIFYSTTPISSLTQQRSTCYSPGLGHNRNDINVWGAMDIPDEEVDAPGNNAVLIIRSSVFKLRDELDAVFEENYRLGDIQSQAKVEEIYARNFADERMMQIYEEFRRVAYFPNEQSRVAAAARDERLIELFRAEETRLQRILEVERELNAVLSSLA